MRPFLLHRRGFGYLNDILNKSEEVPLHYASVHILDQPLSFYFAFGGHTQWSLGVTPCSELINYT